jgi:hypothetical protein
MAKNLILAVLGLVLVVSLAGNAGAQATYQKNSPKAGVSGEPDFTSQSAVIADLERMKKEGQAKNAQLVVVKCNYAINTINNFMRLNPQGDPSILKQRWQEAYNEYKKIK